MVLKRMRYTDWRRITLCAVQNALGIITNAVEGCYLTTFTLQPLLTNVPQLIWVSENKWVACTTGDAVLLLVFI